MDLYRLLPAIVRFHDEEASGGEVIPVLRRIVQAIELQGQSTQDDIAGLADILDIDVCDEKFLPYLSFINGERPFSDWPVLKKRMFVGDLAFLYKIKAMPKSLMALLYLFGVIDIGVAELFKTQLHETFDYIRVREYQGLRAARIEYYHVNSDGEETCRVPFLQHVSGMANTCPSISVDGIMSVNSVVDISDVLPEDKIEVLRRMYPIHVLERRSGHLEDGKQEIMSDELASLTEGSMYCSCQFMCETACETDCESGGETSGDPGLCDFQLLGEWEESVSLDDAGYYASFDPLPVSCAGLQVYIEDICQSGCEAGACQGGACEGYGCQVWCQNNCQDTCTVMGCQVACEATCENPCMSAAQS